MCPGELAHGNAERREIDRQHEYQFELLDRLHAAIAADQSAGTIGQILDEFVSFSEVHFETEHLAMRLFNYPGHDDHVRDHENLVEALRGILSDYQAGEKNLALDEALRMKGYLIGHIQGRDHALLAYLDELQEDPA
ncbi:MAG: hemerythrin family protein [Pseudomonadota bacterium]|nr:MAG: hemerythrin family protein [Pseudomonadota bacterium]